MLFGQGSDTDAHHPTVAVAAPTNDAATTEKPATRLSPASPAESSNINRNDATFGR